MKINLSKSHLYARGVTNTILQRWEDMFGFSINSFPFTYLGAPVGHNPKSPQLNKIDKKLATWKEKSLNLAERLTLIKSTINNILSYWFNFYNISNRVCASLEKRRRNFF